MISIDPILIIFLQYQGIKSRVEKAIKKSLVIVVKRTRISRVLGCSTVGFDVGLLGPEG